MKKYEKNLFSVFFSPEEIHINRKHNIFNNRFAGIAGQACNDGKHTTQPARKPQFLTII
jgi:hypothetical protein